MSTETFVWVQCQVQGMHNWENCNIPEVDFLKYPHRHLFHIKARADVAHNDRDLEFFMLKNELVHAVSELYKIDAMGYAQFGSRSCEMIAKEIISWLVARYRLNRLFVTVSEDGENGADVEWRRS